MTDRRSHWDTDLVEGVGRRLIPRYRSIDYCTDAERHRIYTLIEFVEDWRYSNIQVHWQGMTATERNLSEALGREQRGRAELEAAIARVRDLCQESGPGWIEWLMPGVATTHIAHVSEDGYIYLPGGEGTDDFLLASARGRSWRLLSVVDIARAIDGGAE